MRFYFEHCSITSSFGCHNMDLAEYAKHWQNSCDIRSSLLCKQNWLLCGNALQQHASLRNICWSEWSNTSGASPTIWHWQATKSLDFSAYPTWNSRMAMASSNWSATTLWPKLRQEACFAAKNFLSYKTIWGKIAIGERENRSPLLIAKCLISICLRRSKLESAWTWITASLQLTPETQLLAAKHGFCS